MNIYIVYDCEVMKKVFIFLISLWCFIIIVIFCILILGNLIYIQIYCLNKIRIQTLCFLYYNLIFI